MKVKLFNILMSDDIENSIKENESDLFEMIPELKSMVDFPHNHPHHHLDVWGHTLLALSLSSEDFIIRVSLLLHDIGKPFSYQDKDVRHFHGHAIVSSRMSSDILNRLGFNEEEISKITYLIMEHDTPISKVSIDEDIELSRLLFNIQVCDGLAHNPETLDKRIEYIASMNEKINTLDEQKRVRNLITMFN